LTGSSFIAHARREANLQTEICCGSGMGWSQLPSGNLSNRPGERVLSRFRFPPIWSCGNSNSAWLRSLGSLERS